MSVVIPLQYALQTRLARMKIQGTCVHAKMDTQTTVMDLVLVYILNYRPFNFTLPILFLDINECAVNASACNENQTCSNTVPGYTCSCTNGYADNGDGNCIGMSASISTGNNIKLCLQI